MLGRQLKELGELHESVTDEGLARLLAGVVPHLYKWVGSWALGCSIILCSLPVRPMFFVQSGVRALRG